MDSDEELMKVLKESKTIAVVGCSRDPEKEAHRIPKYLKEHGYRIIPVNPFADKILGERVYKRLSDIKEPVDVIDVFRPSEECLDVVKDAIKIRPKAIWMQLGIKNKEAAELAKENGIKVVMDRCMMVEHRRMISLT